MGKDHRCDRIEEHLDGVLPPDEAAEMDRHLRSCPACRSAAETHGRLRRLAPAAAPVPIPADLGDRIRARLEKPIVRHTRRPADILPLILTAAAAVLLVVLLPPGSSTINRGQTRIDHIPVDSLNTVILGQTPNVRIGDFVDQARNAGEGDAAFLAEEARSLGLLSTVRGALVDARGAERRHLLAAEDLLIQLLNEPAPGALADEARTVAMARTR